MSWSRKKVLVTGAGGFIGSHLAEALVEAGAKVRGFLRYNSRNDIGHLRWADPQAVREMELIFGDLNDPDSVGRAVEGATLIYHLGAVISIPYSYLDPAEVIKTNILGTTNILQQALKKGVDLVVHTSTSEVYGTARFVPITEDHPLQAQSPYSASKIAADKIAESYCLSYGLPVVILRPFNTYGPRQSRRAIIPTIITQALAGSKIRLGSLWPTRDFTYVSDTVAGFLSCAGKPRAIGQTINLGTGRDIPVRELAQKILAQLGVRARIVYEKSRVRPPGSEVGRLRSSPRRALRLLGWKARVTLPEGLKATLRWFEDHRGDYPDTDYAV